MSRTKKHKSPKDIIAAINKAAREEEFVLHGKAITFRTTLQASKKKYKRVKYKFNEQD